MEEPCHSEERSHSITEEWTTDPQIRAHVTRGATRDERIGAWNLQ